MVREDGERRTMEGRQDADGMMKRQDDGGMIGGEREEEEEG